MKVDGVSQFEQLADVGRLRDIESEDLIMVKVAHNQVVHVAPGASQANCSEDVPAMGVGEVRYRSQKPNRQERTRCGAGFRVGADR